MNELFLILFLSIFIFFSTFTLNLINPDKLDTTLKLCYIDLGGLSFFFAVPKKRKKISNPLKKKIINKIFTMRRLNVKSIHFDEFFNNMPKWEEYK